ncbi:MAG: DJ-1/PfpI family protein [Candidatus Omnitrophica bacterium]|nr:DJ-1/PfpI family protein [Candidatus Omnitrophota bacterium]
MQKKVLIILAEGFEEIEAMAPIDILRRADIDVTVAGLSGLEVTGGHGIKVLADKKLDNVNEEFDGLVLPGGSLGAENLAKSEKVKNLIKNMNEKRKVIAAICASPAVVLVPTGILYGKKATCYPGMEKEFLDNIKFTDESVVVDGNIVTSKGPATAVLFGVKIAEILSGKEKVKTVKSRMLL